MTVNNKERAKTLKEISQILDISIYRTYKIRDIIADNIRRCYNDWLIPNRMIFGENGYSIKRFGEINQQLKKSNCQLMQEIQKIYLKD